MIWKDTYREKQAIQPMLSALQGRQVQGMSLDCASNLTAPKLSLLSFKDNQSKVRVFWVSFSCFLLSSDCSSPSLPLKATVKCFYVNAWKMEAIMLSITPVEHLNHLAKHEWFGMLLFYWKLRDENLSLFVDWCYMSEYISRCADINICIHAEVQTYTRVKTML